MQRIVDLAAVQSFTVYDLDGGEHYYTSKAIYEAAPAPSLLKRVEVHTLSGFAKLIEEGIDNVAGGKYVILVNDHRTVELLASDTDKYGRRQGLITATPVDFEGFPFGRWIPQEEFVIGVAAKFADTPDKNYVLSVASSLTAGATSLSEDDGFTQRATVKAGMKTAETVTLKGKVDLAPFRTFPEVGQPISSFVFRAKSIEGAGPALMLVEADGGKWKIDAINEVKSALQ
ncbi:MAG: hypothetical protein WAK20_03570, partial [Candidatus Acidiferrum sp.]